MLFYQTKLKLFLTQSVLVASLALVPQGAWAQTLHAIIVADTNDTEIGPGVSTDKKKIEKLVDDIVTNTRLQKKLIVIEVASGGGGYEKVKEAVEKLSVTSNDVVLFYYSGHGVNTGSKWPGLKVEGQVEGQETLPDRLIQLEWVKNTLWQKNPRFLIAMADTCNIFRSGEGSREGRRGSRSAYEQLFLDYSGYIIASAAIPEQRAFDGGEGAGGYFTQQFLKYLNQSLKSDEPKWEEIMKKTSEEIPVDYPGQFGQKPQSCVKRTEGEESCY